MMLLSLIFLCASSATGTAGGTVTDGQIMSLSSELHKLDVNNVMDSLAIALQGKTSSGSAADKAPKPLCTSVPALTADTYVLFEALRDNYDRSVTVPEDDTVQEQAEVTAFLDAVMATPLMARLDQFMADNNLLSGSLRANIEEVWFTLYSRSGDSLGSSGFEHSFMGEVKSGSVSGFHNWVSFCREEEAGNINYKGYIEYEDMGDAGYVLVDHFTWYDTEKPIGGSLMGTSPEYDLAVYTLCFFARPNQECRVQANGIVYFIQTWQMESDGKQLVGSAYPGVV